MRKSSRTSTKLADDPSEPRKSSYLTEVWTSYLLHDQVTCSEFQRPGAARPNQLPPIITTLSLDRSIVSTALPHPKHGDALASSDPPARHDDALSNPLTLRPLREIP